MVSYDELNKRLGELTDARFKDFEQELLRGNASIERNNELEKKRVKHKRDLMSSIGIDPKKFDEAAENDNRVQEAELKRFLEEFRPKSANRRPVRSESNDIAIRRSVLAEAGHMVVPVFASSLFAADKAVFDGIVDDGADWTDGAINSGWVFPDDPTRIRIKAEEHSTSISLLCWPNHYEGRPEFATHFTFTPATTGTYEMTAVLGFHGFYALASDDSAYNCRFVTVDLTAQMNVHQYVSAGWKDFPPLLYVEKSNVNEVTNYDRTHFLDYTTALRAGDPVIVTVKGVVHAFAHGGATHAELNFEAGTANYIEPLFMNVIKL